MVSADLKDMFITLSTNKDLRNIIRFYEQNGLDKEDIIHDFFDTIEKLDTVEISERISIPSYVNFENIVITDADIAEAVTANPNAKDVQLAIISERNSLSKDAIQNMLGVEGILIPTLDTAIINAKEEGIEKIESEKLCLLSKEAILKIYNHIVENLDKCEKSDISEFTYLLSLKQELTVEQIDSILDTMKKNNIEMDNYFLEGLFTQKYATKEQKGKIIRFEKTPSAMAVSYGLDADLYTEKEIMDIYKKATKEESEEIKNLLLNSSKTPTEVLSYIYANADIYTRQSIKFKAEKDPVFLLHRDKILSIGLLEEEVKMLTEAIKKDARLLNYAVGSSNPEIVNAAYDCINKYFRDFHNDEVYFCYENLILTISQNNATDEMTLVDILSFKEDVLHSHEDIKADMENRILLSKDKNVLNKLNENRDKIREDYEDAELDYKIKSHRTYSDYDYNPDDFR